MRIGELKHRITLQRRSITQSDSGEPTETWVDLGTRWAKIEPLSSKEYFSNLQQQSQITHKVTMRYTNNFTPTTTDQILYGSRTFHIESMLNVGEENKEYTLMVKEQT